MTTDPGLVPPVLSPSPGVPFATVDVTDAPAAVQALMVTVDRMAQEDAGSGAWDLAAIESLTGPFPREREIEHLVERTRAQLRLTFLEATGQDEDDDVPAPAASAVTSVAPVATTARLAPHETRHEPAARDDLREKAARHEQQRLLVADLAAQEQREAERRTHAGRVLRGEVDDHGVRWTGEEPSEPLTANWWALALRVHRMRVFFVTLGMTLMALAVEWFIIKETLKQFVRSDSPVVGLVYAAPAVLIVTVVPHVLGVMLATERRREARRPSAVAVMAAGVAVWAGSVFFIAHLRADMAQQVDEARRLAAAVADSEVVTAAVPYWQHLGLWMAVLLGVGISLVLVKNHYYNPVLEQAMRSDAVLVQLRSEGRKARAELVRCELALRDAELLAAAEEDRAGTAGERWEQEERAAVARRLAEADAAAREAGERAAAGAAERAARAVRRAGSRDEALRSVDALFAGLPSELRLRYRSGLVTAMASPELSTAIVTVPEHETELERLFSGDVRSVA